MRREPQENSKSAFGVPSQVPQQGIPFPRRQPSFRMNGILEVTRTWHQRLRVDAVGRRFRIARLLSRNGKQLIVIDARREVRVARHIPDLFSASQNCRSYRSCAEP